MADLSIVLSVVMAVIHFSAFALYCRAVIRNESVFYTAMWVLTTVSSNLNGVTYLIMTGDLVKSAVPLANAISVTIVLFIGWRRGKVKPLTRLDWTVLGIGLAVIAVWIVSGSASCANLLLQLALMIAIIPAFVGVWQSGQENVAPWSMWACAHAISLVVIALRWDNNYDALVSPVLYIIINLGIIATTLAAKQRIRKNSR